MAIDERRKLDISNIEKIILKLLKENPKITKDELHGNVVFRYGDQIGESMSAPDYNLAIKAVSKKLRKPLLLSYTFN